MKFLLIIIFSTILYSQDCDTGFTYFEDVPVSTTSIPFGVNCFADEDLQFLNDLIAENEFEYNSPIEIGTQTWFDGKLNNFVAGYYTSGVSTQITIIPESISNLDQLRTLYMEWNNITALPTTFGSLVELRNLYISNNELESLINNIGDLVELQILDLGYNNIEVIPNSLVELENLQYLWLFNNNITALPENICDIENMRIYLNHNQLCPPYPNCLDDEDIGVQNTTDCSD